MAEADMLYALAGDTSCWPSVELSRPSGERESGVA
jgi:hypothetical protein